MSVAHRKRGRGPAVLLPHGLLADGRMWWPQLDGLSDEFTIVAWDAPGCGAWSDPEGSA